MSDGGTGGGRLMRWWRWLAIVALIGATSVVIVLGLEATTAKSFHWWTREHLARLGPDTLLLSTLLVTALVLGLFGLTGRLRRAIPLASMVAVLVAAVNHLKIRFRGEPLYPSDFAFVGEAELLISSVGIWWALALVGAIAVVGIVAWLGVLGMGTLLRVPPAPRGGLPRWVVWGRVTAVVVAVVVAVLTAGFNNEGNPVRRAFERTGSAWIVWSQNENYRVNGFVGAFLFNMPSAPMNEPEGYSRDAVLAIADRYADKAHEVNRFRDPDVLADTNVVVILGESFIDPLRLEGLELGEDPIPFTRALMDDTMSGTMHTVAFGGGTANVEFEVLTGMSTGLFAQTLPPYQGLVASADTFPSVLSRFEGTHHTVGIHPFVADFYRRGDAYRAFGFDETKFQDTVGSTAKVSTVETAYISDAAAYEELLGDLEEHQEPVFAKVVTMQNHAGYANLYPDPIPVLAPDSAKDSWGLSDYLRGLSHADAALQGLLADLEALGEDTVVLFYGDHAPPSVIPADLWDAQESQTARYETPWFVWSTEGVHPTRHQGLVEPTHLWNQVLRATEAPITPWEALLLELEAQPPSEKPTDLDRLHELLQYDLAVGGRHAAEALFTVPAP